MEDEKKPDEYSNAWYRQQFRGVMHSLNRCNAEYESCWETCKMLAKRVESLESELAQAKAEMGRLNEESVRLDETITKARKAFRELRNESNPAV